jgi:pimeloyl-ACP methyl ester carboxylesterase
MATSRSKESIDQRKTNLLVPVDSGKFHVNGHRLYWERHGNLQAPCVMLLHHGLGSIRSWRHQVPALAGAGLQVLVYDRWGYGRSEERPVFDQAFLAQDRDEAFALLDHLDVKDTALLGHSDGGSVALLMAAQQPGRVKAMIAVAAHIYFEPLMTAGLESIVQAGTDPAFIEGLRREHGQRALPLLNAWIAHWRGADLRSLDLRECLPAIKCPCLIIQGELDEHASPQHAIDIAEGVQLGTLWLIPGVRHMAPQEVPGKFNRRVLDFLAQMSL